MQPLTVIGIDIGGTRTRVGVVDDEYRIIAKSEFSTPTSGGRSALVGQLAEHIEKLHGLTAGGIPLDTPVGIAVPGLVDSATGVVARSVNLPFLEGASIRDILPAGRVGAALLMTDIEAATWAEYRAHEEAVARFVHLRIGTGVGCGMIVGGSYVEPPRATPGHADVLIVDDRPDAPSCVCGRRGCLELFVSRRALSRKLESAGWTPGREQSDATRAVIDKASEWLSKALARLVETLGPSVICLGGGVVHAWPDLLRGADGETKPIRLATLGDDAGMIGAALRATPSPFGRGLG